MKQDQYTAILFKYYQNYLRDIVLGKPFVSFELDRGKKRPDTTKELHERINRFLAHEKKGERNGWTIEWEEWRSKKLGLQSWPAKITVAEENDLAELTGKREELIEFKKQLSLLLSWRPEALGWLAVNTQKVLSLKESWSGICAVIDYILLNDLSGYYLRNLPVPVHTKFIEENESVILSLLKSMAPDKIVDNSVKFSAAIGLKQKQFVFTARWLDMSLAQTYMYGMEIFGTTAEGLRCLNWKVHKVILVENETSLYLLPQAVGVLAICSSGKALSLLENIPLFNQIPVFYWGDLDEDGFEMLNNFRYRYRHVKSLFMDAATLSYHSSEMLKQPGTYKTKEMTRLFPEEHAAFTILSHANGRIEQEKLHQNYTAGILNDVMGNPH